jgi:molybdopterin biosynthesis enzyme
MLKKDVDELKEGMIVAMNVYYDQEEFLVKAKTVLTEATIGLLRSKGIDSVHIEPDTGLVAKFSEVGERVDRRFEEFKGHRIMERIAAKAKEYIKSAYASGANPR